MLNPNKIEHAYVNRKITELFGNHVTDNQPKFRVIWSTEHTERRFLRHLEPTAGKFDTIELPKYSFAMDRWIIERFMPNVHPPVNEVAVWDGYEMIWVIEDKDGNYLPLNLEFCRLIINFNLNGVKRTLSDMKEDELEKNLNDKNKYLDIMNNRTFLQDQLKDGEAVSLSGLNIPKDVK